MCAKARREEVEYFRRHKVCSRVPRETCLRETGKATIKTGWAETDKGQPGKPNVRARWVAKEYQTHSRPELYASTPPLEALKTLFSLAVACKGKRQIGFIDVKKAHLYAKATRDVFIELPPGMVKKECATSLIIHYMVRGTPHIIGKRSTPIHYSIWGLRLGNLQHVKY